jgi:hypothetical protein
MKRSHIIILTLSLFIVTSLMFVSCAPKVVEVAESPDSADPDSKFFTLAGPENESILSLNELKTLPVTQGQGGIVSSTGRITIPALFKGVAIKDLISYLNVPFDESMGVTVTAVDGYSMTLSYDQVMGGNFVAYDPANGNELPDHDPLTAIVAYEREGQLLNATEDGILRMMVVGPKNNQIVDGHWSVKWVTKVEVKPVGETWVLDLTGAISEPVTRDSFLSCGSPSCHGTVYKDENGQNWLGVPLWLLVGQVDDADSHTDQAYNLALADEGYSVDITSLDGRTITLNSQPIKKDYQYLIAHQVNDGELPEMYYPLRLVGSSVQADQMLGQISSIKVNVPPLPTETVEPVLENDGSLTIAGMVNQEIFLRDADLKALEIVTVTAEGKNGPQDFQGVYLNPILDKAGLKEGAEKLVFTASDNYVVEVDLEDVRDCSQSLLAFMDTPGTYMIVLPELPTSTWAKNVIRIEVK